MHTAILLLPTLLPNHPMDLPNIPWIYTSWFCSGFAAGLYIGYTSLQMPPFWNFPAYTIFSAWNSLGLVCLPVSTLLPACLGSHSARLPVAWMPPLGACHLPGSAWVHLPLLGYCILDTCYAMGCTWVYRVSFLLSGCLGFWILGFNRWIACLPCYIVSFWIPWLPATGWDSAVLPACLILMDALCLGSGCLPALV